MFFYILMSTSLSFAFASPGKAERHVTGRRFSIAFRCLT